MKHKTRVLFATKNKTKVDVYTSDLKKLDIEVVTIPDLTYSLKIVENGDTPLDNAKIKAEKYYNEFGYITIGEDDGLYIEGLADEEQPKNYVRRVNGKELTDSEMISHYTKLVKKLGGKVNACWKKGVAIYDGREFFTYEDNSAERIFIDKSSPVVHEGYPLDSITWWDELGKYTSELTNEEMKQVKRSSTNVQDFIVKTLKKIK